MSAVAGLRPSAAIVPCPVHGDEAQMLACAGCQTWWAYRESLQAAAFWRDKYRAELRRRLALERLVTRE